MKKKLTIVVPAYNVQEYLNKNLEIYADEMYNSILEVIIVNDGSTDNTEQIAKEYIEKYPKIFKLINKENGGHGSTVNVGIANATGKYFKIVDGDDWLNSQELRFFLTRLNDLDVDVVVTNYQTVNIESRKVNKERIDNVKYNYEYKMDEIVKEKIRFPMATLCYKTEILKNNNIRLLEKTYYVDEQYNIMPFAFVKSVYCLDLNLYNYLIGNINQSIDIKNQIARMDQKIKVVKASVEFINKQSMEKSNFLYCANKIAGMIGSIYSVSLINNENLKEGKSIAKQFKNYIGKENRYLEKRTYFKYYFILSILHNSRFGRNFYLKMHRENYK